MKSRVNLWIIASVIISDDTAPLTGCFFYVNSKLRQQFSMRVLGRSSRRKGSGKRRRRLKRGEDFPLLYKNQQHSFYKAFILRNEVSEDYGTHSSNRSYKRNFGRRYRSRSYHFLPLAVNF